MHLPVGWSKSPAEPYVKIYCPDLIRCLIRCLASADIPRAASSPSSNPSLGAASCKKLICSKYRRHQAQIKKCRRFFNRILTVSGCSSDRDVSRDISAQLGV